MANTSAIQIILAYALEHNSGQEAAILDRRPPTKLCAHIPGNAPFDPAEQRATQATHARAAQRSYSRVSHDRCGLLNDLRRYSPLKFGRRIKQDCLRFP